MEFLLLIIQLLQTSLFLYVEKDIFYRQPVKRQQVWIENLLFFYLQSKDSEPWNQRTGVSLLLKHSGGNGQKWVILHLEDQAFLGVLRLDGFLL